MHSTGGCLLRGPVILKATCKLQLTQWPFDNQTCKVSFGSFTSGKDRMIIKQAPKRGKGLGSDLSGKFSKKQYQGNVSSDVFERRRSTASGLFVLLSREFEFRQIVSISENNLSCKYFVAQGILKEKTYT